MIVFFLGLQVSMAHRNVVDIVHLERNMVKPDFLTLHTQERMVVDIFVTGVDPVECRDNLILIIFDVDFVR